VHADMAEKMGMLANSPVENLSFLEVTRIPWRSDEVSVMQSSNMSRNLQK
jgi:hypothetical protein